MKYNNLPINSFAYMAASLEDEYQEEFCNWCSDLTKEFDNKLCTLDEQTSLSICTEVMLRLCAHEICRWLALYSASDRQVILKKIVTECSHLSEEYSRQIMENLND